MNNQNDILLEDIQSFIEKLKSINLYKISEKSLQKIILSFKKFNVKNFKQLEAKNKSPKFAKVLKLAKKTGSNIINFKDKDPSKIKKHVYNQISSFANILSSENTEPDLSTTLPALVKIITYAILPIILIALKLQFSSTLLLIISTIPTLIILMLGVIIIGNLIYQFSVFLKDSYSMKQAIIKLSEYNLDWKNLMDTKDEEYFEILHTITVITCMFIGLGLLFILFNIPLTGLLFSISYVLCLLAYIELGVLVIMRSLKL